METIICWEFYVIDIKQMALDILKESIFFEFNEFDWCIQYSNSGRECAKLVNQKLKRMQNLTSHFKNKVCKKVKKTNMRERKILLATVKHIVLVYDICGKFTPKKIFKQQNL